MNFISQRVRQYFSGNRILSFSIIVFAGVIISAGIVSAATTISTDIQTDGQLNVTSTSTFFGNVGIGTSTPTNALGVAGNIDLTGSLSSLFSGGSFVLNAGAASVSDQVGTIIMRFNGPNNKIIFGGDSSISEITTLAGAGHPLYLKSNGYSTTSPTIAIMNNGYVGIGTSAPRTTLEINGDVIVGSSTNLNINNPTFGYGVNNINSALGNYLTIINGSYTNPSGGIANLVIGGLMSLTTSGSNYNTAIGPGGASITGPSQGSIAFGKNTSIASSSFSTAIGYGASISSLDNTMALGSSATSVWVSGKLGIGTTTPIVPLQVTTSSTNATTTVEIGKTGQTKGSCLALYDAAGNAIYASVAAGATTFTLSTVSCK